eukprot:TRINITY_DN12177_c1_g1_i3.p2 TRINITY_DN12177_c1_g1~~TRINITY_DN12177_c1_g1_i3.p2  ORF type:complete len:111 (+),score=20.49 TRINITY_DN12177_c1_g1_i3:310-642(+)
MGRCARVSNNSSGQWLCACVGLRERLSPETGVPSVLPRLGSTAFSNNVPAKATPVEGQRGGCTLRAHKRKKGDEKKKQHAHAAGGVQAACSHRAARGEAVSVAGECADDR